VFRESAVFFKEWKVDGEVVEGFEHFFLQDNSSAEALEVGFGNYTVVGIPTLISQVSHQIAIDMYEKLYLELFKGDRDRSMQEAPDRIMMRSLQFY
jgi:hypothetical protein